MLPSTLKYLKCPSCDGALGGRFNESAIDSDVMTGEVRCDGCGEAYPILAGVLVLVEDVRSYLLDHVKGIARHVEDADIPKAHRAAFAKAKKQIQVEHIEEDLEAERVTALYLMTHYLRASEVKTPSPVLAEVIKKHWDHGPFEKIGELFAGLGGKRRLVELGCGVGGLLPALDKHLDGYLGLDSSFASIALARHFALGARRSVKTEARVPDDLLLGSVSRTVPLKPRRPSFADADFVVCDLAAPPLREGEWTATAALNVIDMLPEPQELPKLQHALLAKDGVAIQSCPYIWHEQVARALRALIPESITGSAAAVEWLYKKTGFKIESSIDHVPWVFFKNARQLELYSVHVFAARKA